MMNRTELNNLLLHYGKLITDDEYQKVYDNGYTQNYRVRIFGYNGKCFYSKMINGNVIECFELK